MCARDQAKTHLAGAFAWFWLPPRDSLTLQTIEIGVFSTVVPAQIPYAEKGISIATALSRTLSGYSGPDRVKFVLAPIHRIIHYGEKGVGGG
jgi:hypothetical protein